MKDCILIIGIMMLIVFYAVYQKPNNQFIVEEFGKADVQRCEDIFPGLTKEEREKRFEELDKVMHEHGGSGGCI